MRNYSLILYKDDSRDGDDAVTDIRLVERSGRKNVTDMCKRGVMNAVSAMFGAGACTEYLFQAENSFDALDKGMAHFRNNDLDELSYEKISLVIVDPYVSFDKVLGMNDLQADEAKREYFIKFR